MDAALLAARLFLAAVFFIAAVAKLADRDGTRRSLTDFGVAAPFAAPFAVLLPVAELTAAVALIFPSTAWAGALGAAVLLLMFVEAIGVSMVRGTTPRCQCFGALRPTPAGPAALLRTLALTAVAAFVVFAGADDVGPGPADLGTTAALVLAAVAVVAGLAAVVAVLFRRDRALSARVARLEGRLGGDGLAPSAAPAGRGLPVGVEAPDFSLPGLHGERLTLGSLRSSGKPVLLVFSDPGSGPCSALLPRVALWQREQGSDVTVALVSRGSEDDNRARSDEHGLANVLLQADREVADAYRAGAAPAAVLIGADGMIASRLAAGSRAIADLVESAVAAPVASVFDTMTAEGPAVGRPAPEIELEDLEGRPFSLLDLEGERVLVLFWDPGCPFCTRMLADLAAWAADPPEGAPNLVVVSRGSLVANHAMDLAATVLVDPDWTTSLSFGASGTPMAVLVDEQGRIASPIAAGAPAIFELLSVETTS